jgi:hypothetical protein
MRSPDNSAENLRALSAMFPNIWRRKSETGSIMDCVVGASVPAHQCPLSGVKRTSQVHTVTSVNDPKQTCERLTAMSAKHEDGKSIIVFRTNNERRARY